MHYRDSLFKMVLLVLTTAVLVATAKKDSTAGRSDGPMWWNIVKFSPVYLTRSNPSKMTSCLSIPRLSSSQLRFCELNDKIMPSIADGVADAIRHCKFHFRKRRWNCPTISDRRLKTKKKPMKHVFGGSLKFSSQESAFVHALVAAGIAHSITKSCSDENKHDHHPLCACENKVIPRHRVVDGQLDVQALLGHTRMCQVQAGLSLSQQFADEPENKQLARDVMNRHNNNVGRMVILENMKEKCKCHGMSGSCGMKACWKVMPDFLQISSILKKKYLIATEMKIRRRVEARGAVEELVKKFPIQFAPDATDLVFYEESPDYCEYNSKNGVMGTSGRHCNASSEDVDGCDLLCCGRGYSTGREIFTEECRCHYVWCCTIECDKCDVERTAYRCK